MKGACAVVMMLALIAMVASCTTLPPTGWQRGGRPLLIPRARWVNGDALVDLDPQGRVLLNGKHVLNVDRAGRVYDAYDSPVALLQPDGHLIGPDDEPMGWVGAHQAILPGEEQEWLMLEPDGLVLRIDDDGDRRPFGQWLGCGQVHSSQTCTLVSHIVGLELRERARRGGNGSGVSLGIGVGVGFGFP